MHIVFTLYVTMAQYQRVTDRRTDGPMDRQNCCRYYSALHCKQCGRAVKIISIRRVVFV